MDGFGIGYGHDTYRKLVCRGQGRGRRALSCASSPRCLKREDSGGMCERDGKSEVENSKRQGQGSATVVSETVRRSQVVQAAGFKVCIAVGSADGSVAAHDKLDGKINSKVSAEAWLWGNQRQLHLL